MSIALPVSLEGKEVVGNGNQQSERENSTVIVKWAGRMIWIACTMRTDILAFVIGKFNYTKLKVVLLRRTRLVREIKETLLLHHRQAILFIIFRNNHFNKYCALFLLDFSSTTQ